MLRKLHLLLLIFVFIVGCTPTKESNGPAPAPHHQNHKEKKETKPADASAKIINKEGKEIGTAQFTEADKGVKLTINASSLPPGEHGFHLHEVGKCTAPDFKSAKGHFNPTQKHHGKNNPKGGKHAGDLDNIMVGKDGALKLETLIEGVTLQKGKSNSLRHEGGTAIVVHEGIDDYKSDPSGDAGKRIACGEIK